MTILCNHDKNQKVKVQIDLIPNHFLLTLNTKTPVYLTNKSDNSSWSNHSSK